MEHLGEKEPQGHDGREDSIAEGQRFVVEGLEDGVAIQELGERKRLGLVQLLAQLGNLARACGSGSMAHGWPPEY
jgi:hypothetical protein